MPKKPTTPSKRTANKQEKTPEENRREVARHIVGIFKNPETPDRLYRALGDAMCDIWNTTDTSQLDESEEYNLAVLNEYAKYQKRGGAR